LSGKAVWTPSREFIEGSRLFQLIQKTGFSDYDAFHQQSLKDVAWFWGEVEKDLGIEWFKPYDRVLDLSRGIMWADWFTGGELNIAHNALDKWLRQPAVKERTAIIWEGEEGLTRKISYGELDDMVNRFANGLGRHGIEKGDRVAVYAPMMPEVVVAMLAVCKIGAIFTPVFSGYGADAVARRINDAGAKMLITADGFYRRGKWILMKEEADKAVNACPSVRHVAVIRRLGIDTPWSDTRDVEWAEMMKDNAPLPALPMKSGDPFYLIYTSGTTGRPKGIVHTHAGFPLKSASDAAYGYDFREGEILFWYTDAGWAMSAIMFFSALLNAGTMVLYDGSMDYPNPGRLWKLAEDHGITHIGVSPTLIRTLMKYEEKWFLERDLSRLRIFASSGEAWNTEPWLWLFHKVGKRKIPIFNYSGGTEISGGILGSMLHKPIAPTGFNSPMPGMDADVFGEDGKPAQAGELVVKQPWIGMPSGFWNDPGRYEKTYWSIWPDIWVHGDWVERDDEGYWYVTGRSDDTLNIAGKRLGPSEMESVLVEHPAVAEAATIGIPDEVKGTAAVCFAVLMPGVSASPSLNAELADLIRERLGKAFLPKTIHFVKELPKTRNGKVMRRIIRSAYLGLDPGDTSSLENPHVLAEFSELRD